MIAPERVLHVVEGFTRSFFLLPPKRESSLQRPREISVPRSTSVETLMHHLHHGSGILTIEGEAFPDREDAQRNQEPTYELFPIEQRWQPRKPAAIETAPSRAVTLWKRPKAA